MKILTLNTWQERGPWLDRWGMILEGIEKVQPDIAAFQEVFNRSWAQEVQKRSGFPTVLFPREPSGLVVYTHFPVSEWGLTRLTQSPLEEYSRYGLWAKMKVDGKRLLFFNTHLSWKPEDGQTRKAQVKELTDLIESKAGPQEAVLVGDLNAPPESGEIRELMKQGKFLDLFAQSHPREKGFSWDQRNPYAAHAEHQLPDRRIDFVLARGQGGILKDFAACDLIFTAPNPEGIWASDHFGLLAEFKRRS